MTSPDEVVVVALTREQATAVMRLVFLADSAKYPWGLIHSRFREAFDRKPGEVWEGFQGKVAGSLIVSPRSEGLRVEKRVLVIPLEKP